MGRPIQTILVAGSGLAAWLAAATVARRLPGVQVTVLDNARAAPAPLDVYAGTRPDMRRFHAELGINEHNLLASTSGVFRLGQRYEGWTAGQTPYSQCFGRHGAPFGRIPFHQAWLRAGRGLPFSAYSMAVQLAEAGRYAPPSSDPRSPFSSYDVGYGLDPIGYRDYLRALALHSGVTRVEASLARVVTAGKDRIGQLELQDGRSLSADLFLDCSGPDARLLTALDGGDRRQDWSRWLPCDRILVADGPALDLPPPVDSATCTSAGWLLEAPLRRRTVHAYIYSSEHLGADLAAEELRSRGSIPTSDPIPLRQGRREHPWIGNCLALGDAAVELEPLGAPNLTLLVNQLEWMLRLLPDSDFLTVETGEYNRRTSLETDFIRDFVILRYALAARNEPFWRAASSVEPPQPLKDTIKIFPHWGKIPGREGERASADDWLAVFFGHGLFPAHPDPLSDTMTPDTFEAFASPLTAQIRAATASAPLHREYLQFYLRSGGRGFSGTR